MKKYFSALLLLSALSMPFLTSCEDDDNITSSGEVFPVGQVKWSSDVTADQKEVISNLINNMVKVEACRFFMGAQIKSDTLPNYFSHFSKSDTTKFVGPVVTVSMPDYYIGRYEITQGEWEAVMDTVPTGNYSKIDKLIGTAAWFKETGKGDNYAAYNISYNDAVKFCKALNAKTGLSFRLPTEAEWECAARGAQYGRGYRYAGSNVYTDVAWCSSNCSVLGNEKYGVHQGGELQANELGLCDMSGNVSEWVANSYYKYNGKDVNNPQGGMSSDTLILRGGSWVMSNYSDFSVAKRNIIRMNRLVESNSEAIYNGNAIGTPFYYNADGSYSKSYYSAILNCGFRIVMSAQ